MNQDCIIASMRVSVSILGDVSSLKDLQFHMKDFISTGHVLFKAHAPSA